MQICQVLKNLVGNFWTLSINLIENYDLSAKNPNKTSKEVLPTPAELLSAIEADDQKIQAALADLREVLGRGISE
jgi:hypothetical protein